MNYAVITPAHNEAENLRRLVSSLESQTRAPQTWVIVDDRSTDETSGVVAEFARRHPTWITSISSPPDERPEWLEVESGRRAGRDVLAFRLGIEALPTLPDVVVKVDADVSVEPDFFEQLLAAFSNDATLGIASGTCVENAGGEWVERYVTGDHVWGATRAYRTACLRAIWPLELRLGWDGIDQLRANALGWTTATLRQLPFRHHRPEGSREGSQTRAWQAQGWAAHYMGYRPSYLIVRALHHARREPSALAMIGAFVSSAVRREPRLDDLLVRRQLRRQQRLRELPQRIREASGHRA